MGQEQDKTALCCSEQDQEYGLADPPLKQNGEVGKCSSGDDHEDLNILDLN